VPLAIRKVVSIDEEKCDGCGACILSCVEGALKVVDGKARLVSDRYCDGLGACLGKCPRDAITVEDRAAEDFDEAAALAHQREPATAPPAAHGCPGSRLIDLGPVVRAGTPSQPSSAPPSADGSELTHWPVQLALVPPRASFLAGADIALIADCVPFAYPDAHRDFIRDHVVLIACPKLDDFTAHLDRLTAILRQSRPRSLSVVHMEVPCCFGLTQIAQRAARAAGSDTLLADVTISTRGQLLRAR
jgi:Pyruvate/2-oxoacid:ferredoxin oxidoreductase delta subunit